MVRVQTIIGLVIGGCFGAGAAASILIGPQSLFFAVMPAIAAGILIAVEVIDNA